MQDKRELISIGFYGTGFDSGELDFLLHHERVVNLSLEEKIELKRMLKRTSLEVERYISEHKD